MPKYKGFIGFRLKNNDLRLLNKISEDSGVNISELLRRLTRDFIKEQLANGLNPFSQNK